MVVADLSVELVYLWVCRGSGAESVVIEIEFFVAVGEVGYRGLGVCDVLRIS